MTRYIDADEIIKYFTIYADEEWTSSELEGLLNNAPTVDVVEVVRCEDCKYGSEDYPKDIFPDVTEETYSCDHSTYSHDKDFYCKYGKRNNNE